MFVRDFDDCGPRGGGNFRGFGGFDEAAFGNFRAGRGMMEPAILAALAEKPMHGYEIITYLEEKTHGIWRPSPGSVYPTLQLMEEKDHVAVKEKDGKKIYELTREGVAEAKGAEEQLQQVFERFGDFGRHEGRRMNLRHEYQREFHRQMGENVKLLRQIFRKGSAEQKVAMGEALDELKTRLEQIINGEAK